MPAADQRLYFLLQLASHRLKKRADAALNEMAGLSTAQAAALSIIVREGPVSQRYIADQLSQRESAVMTMTNRLITAEYIERNRSKADSRAWELTATKKGHDALGKIQGPFSEINNLIDSSMGPDEVDQVAANLRKLLAALNE